MDALAIKEAHLVSLSMGAYTGLQVAMNYPGTAHASLEHLAFRIHDLSRQS